MYTNPKTGTNTGTNKNTNTGTNTNTDRNVDTNKVAFWPNARHASLSHFTQAAAATL